MWKLFRNTCTGWKQVNRRQQVLKELEEIESILQSISVAVEAGQITKEQA